MSQSTTSPERNDRAITINEEKGLIALQVFNEAGFITKVLLSLTDAMALRTQLHWAESQCSSKQRNR
jgi:hypothetical protein